MLTNVKIMVNNRGPFVSLTSILIIFGFVYQLVDLTQDYLKFNHLIEVKMETSKEEIPSMTICANNRDRSKKMLLNELKEKPQFINQSKEWSKEIESQMVEQFWKNKTVHDLFELKEISIAREWENLTTFIRIRRKDEYCLTFYPGTFKISRIYCEYYLRLETIIHLPNT